MPELFVFLIKVNVSLILFCLAYFLILRRLTYYKINRFFLLGGILFSTAYSFIDLSWFIKETPKLLIHIPVFTAAVAENNGFAFGWWTAAVSTFWVGVLFMALRMLVRLYSLFNIHRKSIPSLVNEYPVRLLRGSISTFSFWNQIYLNPAHHQEEEMPAILEHEQVHVRDFHTFDILIAELVTVFYWFNPGAWLMRKAVKENVEFITDEKTLKKGIDRKAYQYSMLKASTGLQSPILINNFNLTAIKRRVIMMNRRQSSSFYLLCYLLLVPAIMLITTAFTFIKNNGSEVVPASTSFRIQESNASAVNQKKALRSTELKISGIPKKDIKGIFVIKKAVKVPLTAAFKPAVETRSIVAIQKADSSSVNTPVVVHINNAQAHLINQAKTFINDTEVSPNQVKDLNPKDIISINVKKNAASPDQSAIYIYTKSL